MSGRQTGGGADGGIALQVIREMDLVEKVLREACARSPDGKITPLDFTNHASRTMRYGNFSPMEVAIIFHYARQGRTPEEQPRLGLRDFGSLLDPKWGPPRVAEPGKSKRSATGSAMHEIGKVSRVRSCRATQLADYPSYPSRRTTSVSVESPVLSARRPSTRST